MTPSYAATGLILVAALAACTTITAPRDPRPGPHPQVFAVPKDQALRSLADEFARFERVEEIAVSDQGIEFLYQGFVGRVRLLCLSGMAGAARRAGWWPAVSLEGRSSWLWPWSTARVLTFYGSMPKVARRAFRNAGAEQWRISEPEVVEFGACG